jgi:hypothetical protein
MSNATKPPKTTTVELNEPISRGDTVIDSIELRKPTSGELRGMALTDLMRLDVDALITLIPRISSPALTEHDCRALDVSDLTSIGTECIGFFMGKSPSA